VRDGRRARSKGDETRERIFRTALARFRRNGLEKTTMREIAAASNVALGAAYYYFPSKEAIVLAYYDEVQRKCDARARAAFAETEDPAERLRAAIQTKLDVLAKDRRLLSALFRSIAEPGSPLSVFGPETRRVREDSIALFDEALATSPAAAALDAATRRVLVLALWSMHMGTLLYFIHDRSRGQAKTRALADRSVAFVASLLPLAPTVGATAGIELAKMLRDAELL
jgi:AcrR family transcriptional regulator